MASKLVGAGVTPDEIRAFLKLPPLPNGTGARAWMPVNMAFADAPPPASAEPQPVPSPPPAAAAPPVEVRNVIAFPEPPRPALPTPPDRTGKLL